MTLLTRPRPCAGVFVCGEHEEAVAATGVTYTTARMCAKVCKQFEFDRRRSNLTFAHHAEVCRIGEISRELDSARLRDPITGRLLPTIGKQDKAATLKAAVITISTVRG